MSDADRCSCGNRTTGDAVLCDWCEAIADEPQHKGHWSLMGTWWCDTCNSPLCELA